MFRRGFKSWSEQTALAIRRKLRLAANAPVDPLQLAAVLAIPVLTPDALADLPGDVKARLVGHHSEAWSAITVSDGRSHLIIVNPSHAETRTNSSLAHELSHVILGHEPSMMFVTPQSGLVLRTHNKEQEDEANWLAGCILLPRDALLQCRKARLSDEAVCQEYGVSPAMLRFRLNSTGVDVQLQRTRSFGSPRKRF